MKNKNAKIKIEYEIIGYSKKISDFSKEIEVGSWEINFCVKSVKDAHKVALLADLKSYGILKLVSNEAGEIWRGSDDKYERVFVTPDVLEWEKIELKQDNDEATRKQNTINAINALPKKVTIYKDKDFLVVAERSKNASNEYSGLDVKYYAEIVFKKCNVGGIDYYVTSGWNRKGNILRKKFAQAIYERVYKRNYEKQSWDEWKYTLKNIPTEFVDKYGAVLEQAVEALNNINAKIGQYKSKL